MSTLFIVLTNCTARKRGGFPPFRFSSSLLGSDLPGTARRWSAQLGVHRPQIPACQLYAGRSIADAKRVADHLAASLYVASAGYGLINANQLIAPYDLTASDSDSGLQSALHHHEASTTHWWDALCGAKGVAELFLLSTVRLFCSPLFPQVTSQCLRPTCCGYQRNASRAFASSLRPSVAGNCPRNWCRPCCHTMID
ncbi:DUF6884 domain-containing protein [Ramlibacter montanisoli]|uniref:DUF6884 domain-containing protein n=1 Tax=Ramlibacter montanisoli TaxID=2732512 RepID=UPI0035A12515